MGAKTYGIKRKIDESIAVNIIFFAILLAGVVIGSFSAAKLDSGSRKAIIDNVYDYAELSAVRGDKSSAFKESIFKYSKIIIVIWVLSFVSLGFIISLLITGFRSYALGFTVSVFVSEFGAKGLVHSATLFVIQNIVFICLCLFLIAPDITKTVSGLFKRTGIAVSKKNYDLSISERFVILLIYLTCVCFIGGYEAYVCPLWAGFMI